MNWLKEWVRRISLLVQLDKDNLYCPHHDARLVLREVKHGKNVGTKFWGCPTWGKTNCSYTVSYGTKTKKKSKQQPKQKLLDKIKNKNGKISALKVIGMILMIPVYVLGFLISFVMGVFPNRKRKF